MEVGYTNSQTWQAWFDGLTVLWDNTSLVFVLSIMVSVGAIVITWLAPHSRGKEDDAEKEEEEEGKKIEQQEKSERMKKKEEIGENEIENSVSQPVAMQKNYKEIQKELEAEMTDDQKKKEQMIQAQQLAAIFRLMKEQEEKFGETSMDDLQSQMRLYC